jgi:glycosyltransferase involved in cell wall biosynthesis
VIWEANAMARPVIGGHIGGIPESIDDGETGFLFEPGNAVDLAQKIAGLQDDPARADAMGARGKAKVEAACAGHYDRIMALYEEVQGGGAS